MFTKEGLLRLHGWAHDCLDKLYAHCGSFSSEELNQELEGFGFRTLLQQFAHLCEAESFWNFRLRNPSCPQNEEPPEWDLTRFSSLAEIQAERARQRQQTVDYINSKSDEELNQEYDMTWPDHNFSERQTAAFTLLRPITHIFHHKGQIVAMCRLLGHPAPETDLMYS
ncbi:DinB family protein [bacterium]|nr:DinB family protein [bacterium]